MRHLVLGLISGLLLAACQAPAPSLLPTDRTQTVNPAAKPRSFELLVKGPGALGAGGAILSDVGAGAVAPAFRVTAAASDTYAPVVKAELRLETLEGDRIGRATLVSDERGVIAIHHLPDEKIISAIASFVVKGKTYEVATLLPNGEPPGQRVVDPITAMIDARIKQVSGGRPYLEKLNFAGVEQVHGICDRAGVEVESAALVAGQPLSVLNGVWDREIAAKVKDAEEQAAIKAFIQAIKTEIGAP